MKKRGDVAVAFVHLIPQGANLASAQVARHERGLAKSRWGIDPDDRPLAGTIQ
jgi:hypothetical protein